jgi:SpoVK/Ycf46/Vps4 family AAA+-type ATPase
MSPLILLYGPPGTGKTSLCQGLAQKVSIRLSGTYQSTKLVEIKTATLLSKFFSESARQIDDIFTKIARMCQDDPNQFICVLIDEVESIAISRESSLRNGESQDSLRATNALLTGLDRTRSYSNVTFLCTSNMYDALDSAFLDRCGLKRVISRPSFTSQYEILRSRLQKLISRGVITSTETLPYYDDAVLQSNWTEELPGGRLYEIVKFIIGRNNQPNIGSEISGRSLTQLPEQAILNYLREDVCTLEMVTDHQLEQEAFVDKTLTLGQIGFELHETMGINEWRRQDGGNASTTRTAR